MRPSKENAIAAVTPAQKVNARNAANGVLPRRPLYNEFKSNAGGHKTFDCTDYAGDKKLEACLNDQDRLTPGTRSESVRKVQIGLLKDGADLGKDGPDGVYGPATARAVRAFKTKYNLGFEQYANVGPGTMAKLDELCAFKPSPLRHPHQHQSNQRSASTP
jgi:hypothetical protein